MNTLIKIAFWGLLILWSATGFSQKINQNKFYSEYRYIIRLDSAQLRFLIQKNKVDTAWIFKNIIDSFYKDSNYRYEKLGYGSYLTCIVQEYNIQFNTYHNHPFTMDVWGINTTNYVILKDDESKVIEDAKVTLLDGRVCKYNVGMASYELPKINNGTIIKVERGNYFDYMVVNPSYYNPPTYHNNYPTYNNSPILPGYIALNQPKYKLNDTLKFKAMLLNKDGSYYNENVSLWLRDEYNNKEKLIKYYKRVTPGAYFGEMVFGDTLTPDRAYTLIFRNPDKQEIKRTNFTLENYELKKNTYELSMTAPITYPGQKIVVVVKAYDANNLPVMDGFAKFNVRLIQVNQVNTNKFFVPDSWYQSIYKFEKELDASGYTTLEIPDTLFRNMDCRIQVEATFSDEDNEVIVRTSEFQYQNKNHIYSIAAQRDSIHVNYFYLSKSSVRKLKLVTVFNNYKKTKEEIVTPFVCKTDYAAIKYELYNNDTLVYEYFCPDAQNLVGIYGKRSCDSIFIALYNPLQIPVHYEIYKNKKKVQSGKTTILEYRAADASTESYYIVWGHNFKGMLRNNYRTQSFHFEEKKLNIEIDQPEEIYPGQELNVNVKVTDARKKPAGNVNLTAYSVNTQFGEIPLPDVPYMGLIRNDEPLHFTQPNFYFFNCSSSYPLKIYQINALKLYRNEMYQLVFSINKTITLKTKIKSKNPEFAVYLFQQYRLQPVVSILLDSQIVYHSKNSIPQQYSFRTTTGKHNLKIRSNSLLINFGEVNFDDSTKYILGVNIDNLNAGDTTRLLPGMFTKDEYKNFLSQTLFIHVDESLDSFKIYQSDKLCYFGNLSSKYKTTYIGKDYFFLFTIPERGDIRLSLNKRYSHDLLFEPSKVYYMNKDEVRSFPLNDKGASGLLYFDNTPNDNYNLNSFQQVYIDPDVKVIDTTTTKNTVKTEKKKRERPFIYYRDFYPKVISGQRTNTLVIYQKHDYVPYKRAWLINKRTDTLSVVSNYQNYLSYVDSGTYDLLLLNDTALCISRNLYLPLGGTMHLFFYASDIKELDRDEVWQYEQIVKKLTKVPFRQFLDSPITIKPILHQTKKTNKPYARIHGTVVDGMYFSPLDNTTIIAEIDGIFKGGALTNEDGEFVLDFLKPGKYMLKIREAGYRYQVIYDLNLEAGTEKTITIRLLHLEDEVQYTEGGEVIYESMPVEERYNSVSAKSAPMRQGEIGVHVSGSSNQYQYSAMSSTPSFLGSRADQTGYFINGVQVVGEVTAVESSMDYWANGDGVNLNNGEVASAVPFEKINEDKMQQRLNELAMNMNANRVRTVFRDYGYWVPNLITNKQGMARFTVRFPDNITSWKTIVPAMNGDRQSGIISLTTKSYKPLVGSMAAPLYLIAGDRINLKGKVINYTGTNQEVKLSFKLNDSLRKFYNTGIEKVYTDTLSLMAGKAGDMVKAAFMLQLNNGYTDGEERKIPVNANGIQVSSSQYINLISDTSIQFVPSADMLKATVYVHNSEVEQLRFEIEQLKHYSYGCTEQTTSKLRALLAEKTMDEALKLPFKSDKEIKQLIKRLNSLRNNDGTWGWWAYDREDMWLTMYVVRTLNEARIAGYSNNTYMRAATRLEKDLPSMNIQNQLEVLNLLKDMDRKLPYDTFINKMSDVNLSLNQRLLYVHLLQSLHKKYDINDVVSLSNQLPGGGLSWGTTIYNYKYDEAANTLLAFDILRRDSMGRNLLPNIRTYFNSAGFTRHTLARAGLINLYLSDWKDHHAKNETIYGEVAVNGNILKSTDFPYHRTFKANDTVNVSHKGNQSYVNIITTRIEEKPNRDETYFRIKSMINMKQDTLVIKPGVITTIQVDVEVFQSSENVMLEIPLPAGFSYYSKPQGNNYVESHREYYNDKTSIFCTSLPRGKYSFSIQVIPKFTGTFHLPPAKIELMYYPEIRNNEVPKVIVVE